MYNNFFYIKGNELIRDSFSDATAQGFRLYMGEYQQKFKIPLPDWFKLGLPLQDKFSRLKRAVETGEPIPTESPFKFELPSTGLSLPKTDVGFIQP